MHLLYIHQYFNTPEDGGGTRSYWICQKLIERGHKVTMITQHRGHVKRPVGRWDVDGIDVLYLAGNYDNKMSSFHKIGSFLSFMISSTTKALSVTDADLLFATSTPLTVGVVPLVVRLLRKKPFVFEVRDLWPEFPIQVGAIKNKAIIKFLTWFEQTIYRKAEHVIALSPGMQDGVLKQGIAREKTSVIPNMSKPDIFYPRERSEAIFDEFRLRRTDFHIVHFGAIAVANGLEYIVDTARVLSERGINGIQFIFVGKGAEEDRLKSLVQQYGLESVRFLGHQNVGKTSEIVNCCDLSITSFKDLPILSTNSPNKLFDSLSAGKPNVVNSAGWTKEMVEQYNCGFYVNPNSPEEFANKILEVKDNKELLHTYGINARELSLDLFDKELLTTQCAEVLEAAYERTHVLK